MVTKSMAVYPQHNLVYSMDHGQDMFLLGILLISVAVAGMFMIELQFYTRHAETVFTTARSVSKNEM